MQWLGVWFIKALLEKLWEKIGELIARYRKQQQNKSEAESNAQADTEKLQQLKPDATKEETDAAIDEASKRF